MKEQLFYRVANIDTNQGLWYNWDGEFTGLIHDEFRFCKNHDLPMPFDERLQGWLSAVETVEQLYTWFPKEDIYRLQDHGWYLYGYMAEKWKEHENHYVIDQQTSVPIFRAIYSPEYSMETIETLSLPNIQRGRRSAILQ